MKIIYYLLSQFFSSPTKAGVTSTKNRTFFDYSSGEKIKIMRAAGKRAQMEQQQLLKAYDARFGRAA